jgi:hypothetical protein
VETRGFYLQICKLKFGALQYEGTKLVISAKLQMLISRFEEIKMLEDETFGEFYSKMSNLRNSMVSLGKTVSDVKLI